MATNVAPWGGRNRSRRPSSPNAPLTRASPLPLFLALRPGVCRPGTAWRRVDDGTGMEACDQGFSYEAAVGLVAALALIDDGLAGLCHHGVGAGRRGRQRRHHRDAEYGPAAHGLDHRHGRGLGLRRQLGRRAPRVQQRSRASRRSRSPATRRRCPAGRPRSARAASLCRPPPPARSLIAFTVTTGTVGPPGTGTDSTGGDAATDAAKYPCPPTTAQQAAGDSCLITFGDPSGNIGTQNISFAGACVAPQAPVGYDMAASDGGVFSFGNLPVLRLGWRDQAQQARRRHGHDPRRCRLLAGRE